MVRNRQSLFKMKGPDEGGGQNTDRNKRLILFPSAGKMKNYKSRKENREEKTTYEKREIQYR